MTQGLICVWHTVLKRFAFESGCVPGLHYIADTGPNKLANLLKENKCCLVVNHRQGGKTTLATLAAMQLKHCYVIPLTGAKVGPILNTPVICICHNTHAKAASPSLE